MAAKEALIIDVTREDRLRIEKPHGSTATTLLATICWRWSLCKTPSQQKHKSSLISGKVCMRLQPARPFPLPIFMAALDSDD